MDLRERVYGSREELLGELNEFLRMPSISAREGESRDFRNCAQWVAGKLEEAGAEARIMETEGHPVVYAEVGTGEPTLLSYGHYDVQPPEPLDLWESDPFEPTIRDGASTPAASPTTKATCSPGYRLCVYTWSSMARRPSSSSSSSRARRRSAAPAQLPSSVPTPISSPPTHASGRAP